VSYNETIDVLLQSIRSNLTALILERDELLRRVAALRVSKAGNLHGALPCGHPTLSIDVDGGRPYCTECWNREA
jgi:hypothetical protein